MTATLWAMWATAARALIRRTSFGEKQHDYLYWLVLGYAVIVTGCLATSIPCGFTAERLPVGLHPIGRPYGGAKLLSAAAWSEAALDASLEAPIDPPQPG